MGQGMKTTASGSPWLRTSSCISVIHETGSNLLITQGMPENMAHQ
jgi:hypothetical protein